MRLNRNRYAEINGRYIDPFDLIGSDWIGSNVMRWPADSQLFWVHTYRLHKTINSNRLIIKQNASEMMANTFHLNKTAI